MHQAMFVLLRFQMNRQAAQRQRKKKTLPQMTPIVHQITETAISRKMNPTRFYLNKCLLSLKCAFSEPNPLAMFIQFIAACTPHLKFPADEPIIKKLKKHYENIAIDVRQSDDFHSMLEKFTIQVEKKGDQTYVVIQEVVNKFKSYKSQSDSDLARKAHVKKLEKLLKV